MNESDSKTLSRTYNDMSDSVYDLIQAVPIHHFMVGFSDDEDAVWGIIQTMGVLGILEHDERGEVICE